MSGGRLSPEQSAYFDAWRGASAIAVLIGHGFQIFQPNAWPIWGAFSTAGVMIFFVLSGYFIHKSLASNLAKGTPVDFVAARVNRILPPFVFSLVLTVALWAVAPAVFASESRAFLEPTARPEFSLVGLLPTALMLNGFVGPNLAANGPLWSLSFEVWYYALAFIFALRWRSAAIAIFALLTLGNPEFAILGIAWLLGVAISANQHRLPTWRWPLALPIFVLPAFLTIELNPMLTMAWFLSVAFAFASHMALMIQREPPRVPLLPSTAKWSYTLYVVHFPLLLFAYGVAEERAMMLPVMLGVGIFAAICAPIVEGVKPWPRTKGLQQRTGNIVHR